MRLMGGRSLREDAGATVVEFTLVFLFLLLPLTLFGMQLVLSTFVRQQATAAARDGVRAAVVGYDQVEDPKSANGARVEAAVRARLAFPPSRIDVRCTGPDSGGDAALASLASGCASAKPDSDRVEVTVEMVPIEVVGPFGIFGPLLPDTIISKASQVVVTKG